MDTSNFLKCVNNLNEYISITHDLMNKFSNSRIQFNMSTVLALKKVRSLEIEYFNKCDENGAAFIILEQILRLPPSKTWSLLGVELISLVQYWLEALRKHLILHNNHWWNFLSTLLNFIEKIHHKSSSIKNILVQETAECLLELATHRQPDLTQRHRVLRCLNLCCADCSREIRADLRNRFSNYFIKLSTVMSSCGDVAIQYSILETLLRWLVPRHDPSRRKEAAAEWFTAAEYGRRCVDIFLERRWQNFFQDARDFINAHNEKNERVVSVVVKEFSIGDLSLVPSQGLADRQYWMDINTSSRRVSLMMEPRLLEALRAEPEAGAALLIHETNVEKLYLHREGTEVIIGISLLDPKQIFPSEVIVGRQVRAVLFTPDLGRIDAALRTTFQDKYVVLENIEHQKCPSDEPDPDAVRSTAADAPAPAAVAAAPRPAMHAPHASLPPHPPHSRVGVLVRTRVPQSWQSPSTASTSSLAMLRDKLTVFSGLRFDREPESVCAVPQLSNVSEVSELEENQSFSSLNILQGRPCGVSYKKRKKTDVNIVESSNGPLSDARVVEEKRISPIAEDEENSVSCLLVATIGSANDSIINDTLDRLPKNRDVHTDNIIDLLAQEALHYKSNVDSADSSITENKYFEKRSTYESDCSKKRKSIKSFKKPLSYTKQTIISNTTTDESNTEIVENTPTNINEKGFVEVEKKVFNINENTNDSVEENHVFDSIAVENFFSQHINKNNNREVVISPSLARKINDSSTESSAEFECLTTIDNFDINNIEIIECINEIVDKVCKDMTQCSEYLSRDDTLPNNLNIEARTAEKRSDSKVTSLHENSVSNSQQNKHRKLNKKNDIKKTKVVKSRILNKKKTKLEKIMETAEVEESEKSVNHTNVDKSKSPEQEENKQNVCKTPEMRRKRKLYSPKDDNKINDITSEITKPATAQPIQTQLKCKNKIFDIIATPYKDIEKIRRESNRKTRYTSFKTENKLCPKSKKLNDVFDKLKDTIEGEKNIILAKRNTRNKVAIYNFTSDSEDDFEETKKTNKEPNKNRNASKKYPLRNTAIQTKNTYSPHNTNNNKRNLKKISNKKCDEVKRPQLIFEQMRKTSSAALDTSVVAERQNTIFKDDPEPIINIPPEMELISDDDLEKNKTKQKKRTNKRKNTNCKKTKAVMVTRSTAKLNIAESKIDDRDITTSPLPGLVVEAVPLQINDKKDSISISMLDGLNDNSQTDKNWSELNNTQNLLLDNEQMPDPIDNKTQDEQTRNNKSNTIKNKFSLRTRMRMDRKEVIEDNIKVESSRSQVFRNSVVDLKTSNSDKSIMTTGKSPITAHKHASNESPPSFQQLNERIIVGRDLEIQDLNSTLKNYFKNLNDQINNTSSVVDMTETSDKDNNEKMSRARARANTSPTVSITRLSVKELNRWLAPRRNSVFGSDHSSNSTSTYKLKSFKEKICINSESEKSIEHTTKPSAVINDIPEIRSSMISPIQLFKFNTAKTDETKRSPTIVIRSSIKTSRDDDVSSKSCNLQRSTIYNTNRRGKIGNLHIEDEFVTWKSLPQYTSPKRRKMSDSGDSAAEAPSTAPRVRDWLNRDTTPNCQSPDPSLKDNIENVLEKVDTTLLEIHHNTSKRLVTMFLEVQKELGDMVKERERVYKREARALLADVVKLVDDRFTEIDSRSQDLDNKFMSHLKEQARDLLRDDCRQKRAMVEILREDVLAARDHAQKARRGQAERARGSQGT